MQQRDRHSGHLQRCHKSTDVYSLNFNTSDRFWKVLQTQIKSAPNLCAIDTFLRKDVPTLLRNSHFRYMYISWCQMCTSEVNMKLQGSNVQVQVLGHITGVASATLVHFFDCLHTVSYTVLTQILNCFPCYDE